MASRRCQRANVTIDNAITLVSTHARDHLPDGRVLAGGPAHYIGAALDRLLQPWALITGEVASVQVRLGAGGERYLIGAIPPISLPATLPGAATILSPIIREILPESIPHVEGILAVDLQGFVRRPETDVLAESVDLTALLQRAHIVKAGAVEIASLAAASRAALHRTVLLLTEGERGTVVRACGEERLVPARRVRARHTIGAGDSYLGAFVTARLRGADIWTAAEFAARFTEDLLAERV